MEPLLEMDEAVAAEVRSGQRPEAPRERPLDVLVALTRSDLRARYGRGAWQIIKWILDPFALVGIYLLVRLVIFDRGGDAVGLSLACSIVPFQIVLQSAISSMNSVALREPILLNMRFNRMLLPLSSVATETLAFGASFGLLAIMMLIYKVAPTPAVLLLPLVVASNLALAIGIAYPAALLGVWFPDLRLFTTQLLRILYFAAPGLVSLSEIHGRSHDLLKINPLTGLFEAYRDTLLYGHAPAVWMLLYPAAAGAALLLLFLPIYRREQHHFAKVIS